MVRWRFDDLGFETPPSGSRVRSCRIFDGNRNSWASYFPDLYLHGLATGDFEQAMRGLLGAGAPLSRASIQRLKSTWQLEYDEWVQQDLSGLEVVYQWADGLYVKAGIAKERAALLVIIGALSDGRKVVLACESGQRESKESWSRILRNLQRRGLKLGRLTVADGHLGIWSALAEQQRAVEESQGNKTQAAQLVDVPSYQTFTNWTKRYGVRT